jgi:putative PIN family toxin of toxin-antitoxin system
VRVVADTNTVLSAFLWGGPPKAVLDAARAEHIILFSSAALLVELEDVLNRDKFAARITRIESTPATLVRQYRTLITLVRPTAIVPISRDPDDDQVLACGSPRTPISSSAATRTCWTWAPARASAFSPRIRRSRFSRDEPAHERAAEVLPTPLHTTRRRAQPAA